MRCGQQYFTDYLFTDKLPTIATYMYKTRSTGILPSDLIYLPACT